MADKKAILNTPFSFIDSAVRTASDDGDWVIAPKGHKGAVFVLDVTDADTGAGDKLDVYIQTYIAGLHAAAHDIAHFTQVLGNGSDNLTYVTKITAAVAQAEYEVGSALGAASVRHLLGHRYRARWVITDAGGAVQSFTFSTGGVFF